MADPSPQTAPSGSEAVAMPAPVPRRRGWGGGGATAPPAAVGVVHTSAFTRVAIRLFDLIGAAAMLILLSPLLILVAVIVKLDSPGPAIFRQRRIGRHMEPFLVAKFRTMDAGAGAERHREHVEKMIAAGERGARPMVKLEEDDRLTRVGSFLRRTSIDELPQLWNVLRGEMSLVGPRPPIQYEVDKYPEKAFRRFAVRPGLTGLWQVRGRSLLTFDEMIEIDAEYVERRSLLLNLGILLRTLPTVIHGKGAA